MNSSPELDRILTRCNGAYSDTTLRGYRNDLEVFKRWCAPRDESWLPATAEGVARFVDDEAPSKSIATLKRRISAIQFAHRMADLPSPIDHSEVHLAVRRAARAKRRRPNQALGLSAELLGKIVDACPDSLAGLRDAALFSVGYDTLCRSSELVAMRLEDLSNDFSSIEVPRSKSDPFGDGRIAYLAPETAARVRAWLDAARLRSGPLFRGLHTGRVSDVALDTSSVRRRIKVAAKRARLSSEVVSGLSGHSMRIGAAQDMMLSGFDTLGIMQAGGWRTQSVLFRYVENASAARIHVRRWASASRSSLRTDRINEATPIALG
jgi:integrase/recombinase XerD